MRNDTREIKRFLINISANIIVFVAQVLISFFLVPYLSIKIGDEAVGYNTLATNIVSYTTIITAALNAMAGRFITLSYHKKDYNEANRYFTSVFVVNILLSFLISGVAIVFICNMQFWLNVPVEMLEDVRMIFLFVFINTCIHLVGTVYNVATFIKNRLELSAIKQIIAKLVNIGCLLLLFSFFSTKMYYQGIATVVSSVVSVGIDVYFTSKLAPELKVKVGFFDVKKVLEICKEGIWNSVTKISEILLTGLDLLIANAFMGPAMMGLLAIAKTIPQAVISLTYTIASTLYPKCAYNYAQKNNSVLIELFNFSIKLEAILIAVPMMGFVFFGIDFYTLWLPEKSHQEILCIQVLSVFTMLPTLINGLVEGLYYANVLTKKIKNAVIVTIIIGIISTISVLLALKITNWGVYAIAGISSVMMLGRALIFTPIYCSYVLRVKWNKFYPELGKAIGVLIILSFTFYYIGKITSFVDWLDFIVKVPAIGVIGYIEVFSYYAIIKYIERKRLLKKEG